MNLETPESISTWAEETFGPARTNFSIAARANQEMAELLRALSENDRHPKAAEETADIIICLCRLFPRLHSSFEAEVQKKMKINRTRKWRLTSDGHGYHIKE